MTAEVPPGVELRGRGRGDGSRRAPAFTEIGSKCCIATLFAIIRYYSLEQVSSTSYVFRQGAGRLTEVPIQRSPGSAGDFSSAYDPEPTVIVGLLFADRAVPQISEKSRPSRRSEFSSNCNGPAPGLCSNIRIGVGGQIDEKPTNLAGTASLII